MKAPGRWLWVALALGAGGSAAAQTAIGEAEALQPPAPARLAQIAADAGRRGWKSQAEALHAAARRAYEHDRLAAAEAWLNAWRWAALFGETEMEFTPRWVREVEDAQVAHANMRRTIPMSAKTLGAQLTPECQAWLIGDVDFSAKFFSLVQPVDFLPEVLHILGGLYLRSPERFKAYPGLALALAVVYDVPVPPDWPHGQVSPAALPRRRPAPAEAFDWWVKQDQLGRTYHRLNRLAPDELKFVIDAAAPFTELEWTQAVANFPPNQLARAYTMIRYRQDRMAGNRGIWNEGPYTLPAILGQGGICVDQAYFACQVGKARGVPTLHFSGAGADGRHAWFGFLDADRKWVLDAGRYAEQRFVTGYARDPQTWGRISDHELTFLAEGFRRLPSFAQSRAHAAFAADYLARGEFEVAVRAARKAVALERRNQAAWETLLAAEAALMRPARQREGTLREAAQAFQRYPSLEALYANRLAASLRARGEGSAAEMEESRIVRKNRGDRSDVSVEQARIALVRTLQTRPLPEQIAAYNALVDTLGRGAGVAFFDQIVVVFAEHLQRLGQKADAIHAVQRARGALKVEPGRQLDQEFAALVKRLNAK
jgi:hypothetical protein